MGSVRWTLAKIKYEWNMALSEWRLSNEHRNGF